MIWVGRVLGKRYRVRRLVGAGRMGEVYEALDVRSAERVAIKVLPRELAQDHEAVERLHREAEIALAIDSEYLAKLLAVGKTQGQIWLAFEFLEGQSLEARLGQEGKLEFDVVAEIVAQTLAALEVVHKAGVIHRDVHPGNIFLLQGNSVRLLDFGVAKRERAGSGTTLTSLDDILGSPAYMSPEQFDDPRDIDARADQYGVGVVAYRAITGRLPFEHSDMHKMIAKKAARDFTLLSRATGRTWPEELEQWLSRTLAPRPAGRFASTAEARAAWHDAGEAVRDHVPTAVATEEDTLVSPRR